MKDYAKVEEKYGSVTREIQLLLWKEVKNYEKSLGLKPEAVRFMLKIAIC